MSRPSSYIEEDIIVKPSSELIADEYEHFREDSSSSILVRTFISEDKKEYAETFIATLQGTGLKLDLDQHSLDHDNCMNILAEIGEVSEESSGLILLFAGYTSADGSLMMWDGSKIALVNIKDIWDKFYSYQCIGLKNKPKIFMFDVTKTDTVETDGKRKFSTVSYELAYDTPGEADILLVYNKSNSNQFITHLSDNIKKFGKSEDVISLITQTNSIECHPMIISTLTRKFYFTASEARGFHFRFQDNKKIIEDHLQDVKTALATSQEPEKKIKKTGLLSSFSFRRKPAPETDSDEKKKSENVQATAKETTKKIPMPKSSSKTSISGRPSSKYATSPPKPVPNRKTSNAKAKEEKPKWRV